MAIKASATVTLTRVNDGKGLQNITNYYLVSSVSSGVTTVTPGWGTTIPTMTTTNKYLWNYEVISYTDGSSSTTNPIIIGVHGATGATGSAGKGISSIIEYYLVSAASSGVTTSTSGWSTAIPTMSPTNKYLWNYEIINYTDGSNTTCAPKIIGTYGETGKGIESITEEYYLSTSKTTQTGGSWVTTPPTWSTGKYMWTRSKIVYKNPTSTEYTTPVCDTSWEAAGEVDNKLTETTNKVAEIVTNLDGITQRVSKTESSITTIDGNISSLQNRIATAEQKITADAIVSTVTSSTNWSDVSSNASTALSTANSAKSTATSAASTASTAKTTADTAKSTADTAKTTADSAKTTATSAASNASTALSTANTAKNTADTAKSTADSALTRISSAELKITAEAILNSVNTQIGAGGAISTTSTILDKNGFTVKNGALTVQNNAGEPVLTSDVLGNLKIMGDLTAGGTVGNSTISVVDNLGKVVFGANYEGAKAKSFEVADLNTTAVPGKDGVGDWNITTGYRNRMTSTRSTVEYDKLATNGIKQSVVTQYDGITMENYGGGILMGKSTIIPGEITVYSNTDKGGGNSTSSISPSLIASGGSISANNGNIAVTNVNATGADVSYLKMIRSNGAMGGQFTSSADGLGVRLHMYNDAGVWASYFRFENTGKLIAPSVEINGTEGLYVNYNISAQNIRGGGATSISNLNARLVSGWYRFGGAANAPCTYGILYTAQWNDNGDFAQLVIGSNNALYTRYYINGGYTAWSTK